MLARLVRLSAAVFPLAFPPAFDLPLGVPYPARWSAALFPLACDLDRHAAAVFLVVAAVFLAAAAVFADAAPVSAAVPVGRMRPIV